MEIRRSHVLATSFLLAGVMAFSITGGCTRSTELFPEENLGEVGQHLDEAQCLYFDVNGKDTICHHTGAANHPYTLIKISDNACIASHSGHALDYITSLDPASPLYDPTCNGQGCLPTDAPCDGTLDCCTGSCVSGTCVDPCSPNPCQNDGTCAASGSSYTCTCTGGYTGTNCEISPPPAGPTIGCHDSPGTSGNNGVDDLYYYGPIDTVNNVRFYRAPRDGTCSGDSYLASSALIEAASEAAAATKCLSITGGSAFDASLWDGLAGSWLCFPGGGEGGG
jgi:hypothetical protein